MINSLLGLVSGMLIIVIAIGMAALRMWGEHE